MTEQQIVGVVLMLQATLTATCLVWTVWVLRDASVRPTNRGHEAVELLRRTKGKGWVERGSLLAFT